jgi:hypothetical protein
MLRLSNHLQGAAACSAIRAQVVVSSVPVQGETRRIDVSFLEDVRQKHFGNSSDSQATLEITHYYGEQGFVLSICSGKEKGHLDKQDIPIPVPPHLRARAIRMRFNNVRVKPIEQLGGHCHRLAMGLLIHLSGGPFGDIKNVDVKSAALKAAREFQQYAEIHGDN